MTTTSPSKSIFKPEVKAESKSELDTLIRVYAALQLLKRNTAARKTKSKSKSVHWNKGKVWPDEVRQKISRSLKASYEKHPELRTKARTTRRIEHLQRLSKDPEVARKRSESTFKLWTIPEYRKKQSERMKTFWAISENRKRILEAKRRRGEKQ